MILLNPIAKSIEELKWPHEFRIMDIKWWAAQLEHGGLCGQYHQFSLESDADMTEALDWFETKGAPEIFNEVLDWQSHEDYSMRDMPNRDLREFRKLLLKK